MSSTFSISRVWFTVLRKETCYIPYPTSPVFPPLLSAISISRSSAYYFVKHATHLLLLPLLSCLLHWASVGYRLLLSTISYIPYLAPAASPAHLFRPSLAGAAYPQPPVFRLFCPEFKVSRCRVSEICIPYTPFRSIEPPIKIKQVKW